jgi:tetrapyrrole methylase family protein / MazG family protein
MGINLNNKEFEELLSIIKKILSEDGCVRAKQDKFDNHLKQIISEISELEIAIKNDDSSEINEELGHVLFDVLYLILLGEREGKVKLEKVLKELNWSMKFRHPHVFEIKTNDIDDVKRLMKERKDSYHKMKKEGKLPI